MTFNIVPPTRRLCFMFCLGILSAQKITTDHGIDRTSTDDAMTTGISIVIPAYNEEQRLGPMLDQYAPYFIGKYGTRMEFVVIVNGSHDRTEEIARGYAGKHEQIRVVVEPRAIGKGGAIMLGFGHARGRLIGFVDADGSTPPEAMDELFEHIDGAGMIIASRWMKGAEVSPRQPLKRRVASRIFNLLVRRLFNVQITDTQCGAKVLTHEVLEAVLPHLGLTRWAFDVDLVFQVHRLGYAITERPTRWRDVTGSRLNVTQASIEMFIAIVRLRLLYSPFKFLVTLYDRTLGRKIHPA